MFVRLFRLLLIHCIYVSVTKPTCSAFGDWLKTASACSTKVTGIAVKLYSMTIQSMILSALDGLSNAGSMCDYKICISLDLSVLVSMSSEIDSGHGAGPRGSDYINSMSTVCEIERRTR